VPRFSFSVPESRALTYRKVNGYLSNMETDQGSGTPPPRPTPEEASIALREAQLARSSLDTIPVPGWYFPITALLVGGLTLSQLLPSIATIVVVGALGACLGGLVRVYANKIGIRLRISEAKGRLVWPPVVAITLLNVTAAVLDLGYGQEWGWIIAAAANAGIILVWGSYLRRHPQKSA
jgi:hypothetical protein